MRFLNTTVFAGVALGAAVPEALPATTKDSFCPLVRAVVTGLHAQSTASAFCQSYLHIPTVTTTLVGAVQTLTSTSYTATVATFPASNPCVGVGGVKKRENEVRSAAKPFCFKSYTKSAQISSACSCLSIPTPTTTQTSGGSTTTATIMTVSSAAATGFKMQANFNNGYAGAGAVISFETYITSQNAPVFKLVTNDVGTCALQNKYMEYAYVGTSTDGTNYHLNQNYTPDDVPTDPDFGAPWYPMSCSISVPDNMLHCSTQYGGNNYESSRFSNGWILSDGNSPDDQNQFTISVIPVL